MSKPRNENRCPLSVFVDIRQHGPPLAEINRYLASKSFPAVTWSMQRLDEPNNI
jgi:hypothetical protein